VHDDTQLIFLSRTKAADAGIPVYFIYANLIIFTNWSTFTFSLAVDRKFPNFVIAGPAFNSWGMLQNWRLQVSILLLLLS